MSSTNLLEAHHQWATRPSDQRFQSLEELSNSVKSRRLRSRSLDVQQELVKVSIDEQSSKLIVNGTITPSEPTHWSFGQLAYQAGAPASYLRTLPLPLVRDCMNHGLARESGGVKFMTIASEDGEVNTLQAVTSQTYGRIWDADVVDAVGRLVERSGGKFHNPLAYAHRGEADGFKTIDTSRQVPSGLYASDRDVFVFMIDGGSYLEAGPRAKLNRGFITWNSEVGNRTFGLMTFLFNGVCGNHILWGVSDVNKVIIRHTQNGPYRFDSEAAPALLAYANEQAKPIEDAIRKAQDRIVWDGQRVDDLATYVNRYSKFTRSEVSNAVQAARIEEGDCRTLWHVVQGFTAYARGFDYIDARVDLEQRAGRLMNAVSVTE